MYQRQRLMTWWSDRLEETRLHVARPDALLMISLLGLVTGLLGGAVIVLFRFLVEGSQEALLPGSGPEGYELLAGWQRALLPLIGAVLLAALFRWGANGLYRLGVVHVIERMAHHQGHMTLRGSMLQFAGAAIAIVAGYSVGREGPHVHLGAATGSLLGQRLALPNNAIRTLVGCGAAAGIAASFNTPLAGVIFALEVVMLEYTVASFIPVILAAVSATLLANALLGAAPALNVPPLGLGSMGEMAYVVLLGILAGTVSVLFIEMTRGVARHTRMIPIWWRMLLAGVVTGAFGLAVPEVMGIGYDTVDLALHGGIAAGLLVVLLLAKLLATSVAIGMGVPGGVIGPVLFVGAMLGALLSQVGNLSNLGGQTDAGFYALLGMGAMMAASFQAPLAALMAMLELTHNPGVILPGMLAVVVAGLTASEVFRRESLFIEMLRDVDRQPSQRFSSQGLHRVGVASAMDERIVQVDRSLGAREARQLLDHHPTWLLVNGAERRPEVLMPAADLARYLESTPAPDESQTIDLMDIPAQRLRVGPIHLQETLQQAMERFGADAEALYVERVTAPGIRRIYGVLTPEMLESAYG